MVVLNGLSKYDIMKNMRFSLGLLFLCVGCASPGYLKDRGHDAADIVRAEFGYGLGAKVRAGPVSTGASWIFTPLGLSNGEFYSNAMLEEECPADVGFFFLAGIEHSPRGQDRGKDYSAGSCVPFIAMLGSTGQNYRGKNTLWPHPYYSEVRMSAGFGPAMAVGFNAGELLDFSLGWFGADIYQDDIGSEILAFDAKTIDEDCEGPLGMSSLNQKWR